MTKKKLNLDQRDRAILRAVRETTGREPCGAAYVSWRLRLPLREVLVRALVLVWAGLLFALDGEPWALTPTGWRLT